MTTMNQLMRFRTTYLRSIAMAWADPTFKDLLISDPKQAMRQFGFEWPWSRVCDLEITSTVNLQYISGKWVYSPDTMDYLTLYVPLEPRYIAEEYRAMALADLYRAYSSLFSDSWGEPVEPIGSERREELAALPRGGGGDRGGAESAVLYPKAEEFSAFQVALLAAIAKAWEDPSYKQKLQIDFKETVKSLLAYSVPWAMVLRVQDDPQASWKDGVWRFARRNVLCLNFPSRPAEVSCQPAALAMYNATGAEYPFTCTC